ncbi:hypothetical protein ACFL6M_07670 [Candidatus Eisenbacteria bacterium]|uniref:Uncharacterized protein n=1 Tax=Eiseniibacteriota bacterium TaxID=2212470 RepID=A0ABV6YMA9_UNCEI
MSEQTNGAAPPSRRDRPLGVLARRMRETLGRADVESEEHRKAALRRLLHEHAAGFTKDEIEELIGALRERFPDRIFESVSSAQGLASRTVALEKDVDRLRAERNQLREQVDRLGPLMAGLAEAAGADNERIEDSAIRPARQSFTPEAQEALLKVATLLYAFALNQEKTAGSVEETLGGGAKGTASESITALFRCLSEGKPLNPDEIETVRRRLRILQLLPGALLTGVQQSWKGGTREVLEYLDPKAAEKNVSGVIKSPAILKEIKQRFEQFWDQFDRNVDHYYRGRFERVYKDKMEDIP